MELNVVNYGAIADAKTINTNAIQKAIDQCHQCGGGRTFIDP